MNALYRGVKHHQLVNTKLLLLGVKDYYETYEAIAQNGSLVQVQEFNQYAEAYDWLNNIAPQNIPSVVICSYEFLAQDGFRFLRDFRKLSLLKAVPFFLLKPKATEVNARALLRMGANDCFSIPIDWAFLNDRISFHHNMQKRFCGQNNETIFSKTQNQRHHFKRAFDILFSLSLLILLSPLLLLIAVAIKIESRGPIIYCSKRAGRNYQIFDFYKFRSMYVDADSRLKELQHLNQYQGESQNCFVKIKNDPRITIVGRLIRKTSLDELPQLINVLKGDMSVVGNRPLPLYEAQLLTKDKWAHRFLAPAGLTGLWQVTKRGKNEMSTEERINLDITYAKNHSFWYDMKILFKTLPAMVQHEDV